MIREVHLTNKDVHFLVLVLRTIGGVYIQYTLKRVAGGNTTHHIGHSLACDASICGPVRLSSITLTQQGGFFLGCVAVGVYSTRRRGEEGAGTAHIYYTHVMN